jgi:outer membrane protease
MVVRIIPLFFFFVILVSGPPRPVNAQALAADESPPAMNAGTGAEDESPPGAAPEAASGAGKKGNHVFSLGFKSGVLWGSSRELVYHGADSGDLLSRLDWELHPLFYFGAILGIGPGEPESQGGFFADLGFAAGIPMDNGTLEDRDWEYPAAPQRLTKFSSHPSATEQALLFDCRVGLSLPLGSRSVFSLFLFFSWSHFRWLGRDGYSQYTAGPGDSSGTYPKRPWGSDLAKDYAAFRGKHVIRYTQDWLIPGLGGGLDFPLTDRLGAGLSLLLSPLVFAVDNDEHLLKGLVFRDYLKGGFFLESSLFLAFSLSSNARLLIKTSYRMITGLRGDAYIKEGGVWTCDPGSAGADMSCAGAELVFEWRSEEHTSELQSPS